MTGRVGSRTRDHQQQPQQHSHPISSLLHWIASQSTGVIMSLGVNQLRMMLTRILFMAHASFVIWRVVTVAKEYLYYLILVAYVLLLLEAVRALITRQRYELKWFSLSMLLLLCTELPCVWLLKLNQLARWKKDSLTSGVDDDLALVTNTSVNATSAAELTTQQLTGALSFFNQWESEETDSQFWVLLITQTLLFVLLVGRWWMPVAKERGEELWRLMFVYLAMTSDMMGFLNLFDEDALMGQEGEKGQILAFLILGLWSLSLLQFPVMLTARRESPPPHHRPHCCESRCCETEIWAISLMLALQEIPFLVFRLYCLVSLGLLTNTILFFTSKNVFVLLLQLHRISAICVSIWRDNRRADTDAIYIMNNELNTKHDRTAVVMAMENSSYPCSINPEDYVIVPSPKKESRPTYNERAVDVEDLELSDNEGSNERTLAIRRPLERETPHVGHVTEPQDDATDGVENDAFTESSVEDIESSDAGVDVDVGAGVGESEDPLYSNPQTEDLPPPPPPEEFDTSPVCNSPRTSYHSNHGDDDITVSITDL